MRIALAEHTTVTYHTESELGKTQTATKLETLRAKLGLPTMIRSSRYKNRRKDHHTEHGVTTIVDLSTFEKAGNTFTPLTARTSFKREAKYASGGKKNGHQSTNSSTEDLSIKEILEQLPATPAASHTRAITFDLPEGHALATRVTQITRGDRLDPEMLSLNRRPTTGNSTNSDNGVGGRKDAPVLFVGENYHHRSDVTPPSNGLFNLKNAIKVTTEKIVKSEGGAQDEQ